MMSVLHITLLSILLSTSPAPSLVDHPDSVKGRMELSVEKTLAEDGPWLLFGVILLAGVGIPISEEILIVPAGFLIERGVFPLWGTVAAAWFGVVLADLMWMLLVRRFAHRLLRIRFFRRMFHPRRLLEFKSSLDRWGAWVVVMGRIIPAARTPVITAAGLAHMPVGRFLLGECLGAAKSVGWQLFIGWLIAKGLGSFLHNRYVRDAMLVGIGVAVLIAFIWWWRRRNRPRKHRPRAPMSWLREACQPPSLRRAASQ